MKGLLVIVPAHNEAKAIVGVVSSIKKLGHDVIVIDDGSVDDTGALAKNAGAVVIAMGKKSGKGNALRQGFTFACQNGYEMVITLDGDGQHATSDIVHFLNEYGQTKADVINGNRLENPKGMPYLRLLTNRFMSWLISNVCGQQVVDSQCGFRLMTTKVLRVIKLECTDFEIETELLIQASKKGFKIKNVPIETIYRDEVSKIRPLKDTWRFIAYLFKESRKQ